MQEQLFWCINATLNNIIIELLPFLILKIKDKYKKHTYLIYILINLFDILFFGENFPTNLSILVLIIMPFIVTFIFFKDVLWKKILVSIIYNIIIFMCEYTSFAYIFLFLNGTYENDILTRSVKYYSGSTFNNMLYFIFILLTVTLWRYFIDKEKDKRLLLFLIMALYQLILVGIFISFSVDYSHTVMWLGLLLVIMNLIVDLIVFFFMKQLEKKKLMDAELAQLYNSYNHELEHYKKIETQIKTLRKQRHEFTNQMQTVSMMIEQKAPIEQIEQYLSNILNALS